MEAVFDIKIKNKYNLIDHLSICIVNFIISRG